VDERRTKSELVTKMDHHELSFFGSRRPFGVTRFPRAWREIQPHIKCASNHPLNFRAKSRRNLVCAFDTISTQTRGRDGEKEKGRNDSGVSAPANVTVEVIQKRK
jgi:hypothetical protein